MDARAARILLGAGCMSSPHRAARFNRCTSLAVVAAAGATLAIGWPEAARRAEITCGLVMSIGYGHLLGAAVGGRIGRRAATPTRARSLPPWLVWLPTALLWAAYLPEALLPLLALSVWHSVENDRALATAFAGTGRLAPLPRRVSEHAPIVAASACITALAAAALPANTARELVAPTHARLACDALGLVGLVACSARAARVPAERGRLVLAASLFGLCPILLRAPIAGALSFADVLAAASGYHLVQWAILQLQRLGRAGGPERARRAAGLLVVHAVAGLPCAVASIWPHGLPPWLVAAVLSPSLYLCVSGVHIAHTALRRGLAPVRA